MDHELDFTTRSAERDGQSPNAAQSFVHEADDYTFEVEVLQRSYQAPVLVDCWAEWCEPCKSLGPTLERLASQYRGRFELVKVNIDQAQRVAMALQVQSVPFMLLFIDGRPVDAIVGNQSESELRTFLDRHLPPDEGDPYELGLEALKSGEYESAVHNLQQAMLKDPDRVEVRIAMARATLATGDLDAAGHILDTIPSGHPLMATAQSLRGLFSLAEFQADERALSARVETNPRDADAWYRRGATMALQGDFDHACVAFLKVVALDRGYLDDGGRKALLLIFDVLGGEGEVVSKARRSLANYLF